jgi:ribosomal-protein-alanine N-acetyltransferase
VPFRRRHLDRILRIERACFAREAYSRGLFLELYEECAGLFFVAKRAGRIGAYMVTCATAPSAEIVSVAVHPDYRRQGMARALIEHTLRALGDAGIRRVELRVRDTNTAGIRLYRSFGFRRAGLERRYYEDGGHAVHMRLALQ